MFKKVEKWKWWTSWWAEKLSFFQRRQIQISYEESLALEGFLHLSKILEDMEAIKIEFDSLDMIFSYFDLIFHF